MDGHEHLLGLWIKVGGYRPRPGTLLGLVRRMRKALQVELTPPGGRYPEQKKCKRNCVQRLETVEFSPQEEDTTPGIFGVGVGSLPGGRATPR
jgi:hypothetical protein